MEIYQDFGNDLVVNQNGDLQVADGTTLSNQRVVRRLLTNPGTYLWNPNYGAGLPQFIGDLNSSDNYQKIKGRITSQMYLEDSVSQVPPPDIELTSITNQLNGTINYTNSITNTQAVITLPVPSQPASPTES
jgi:hypothetical protein